jgi:hypothetical protein
MGSVNRLAAPSPFIACALPSCPLAEMRGVAVTEIKIGGPLSAYGALGNGKSASSR